MGYIRRTHCKHGHVLTDDNVYAYVSKQNHLVRDCKICATAKNHRRAAQLRENHLNRKYGITQKQYEKMLAEQDGKCAGCRSSDPKGMGSFHVDHCHITGKIRKLLCMKCNSAMGKVDDNPETLERLARYIRTHRELHTLEALIDR